MSKLDATGNFCQNDYTFNMTKYGLRCFAGTLILSDYHSFSQQHLYGEKSNDFHSHMLYQFISKNIFRQIKNYNHLPQSSQLAKTENYTKVRSLYDIVNKSLWIILWWTDFVIFCDVFCKQILHSKSVRFGYKIFVHVSSDGYLTP